MVAVISGNGLGLGNTSLTQLGQGLGGQATIGQANVAQVVNSATGNLVLQTQDEGLVFDGLSLNVLRTYNSQGQLTGSAGWQFGFSRSISGLTGTLDTAGSTVTRTADDGSAAVYVYNATLGAYVSSDQSGAEDTLSWSATASSWTWSDAAASQTETYNASGRLTALTDTATGASYSFSYTSNNQLSQIVAGDGDTLVFGYNTANQLISLSIKEVPPGQTTAVTRQQVSYAYDSQGRLSTVTTLLASDTDSSTASYTTTYTYSGTSDRIASVSQTDGTTVSYSYTEDAQGVYQVTGITTGTGAAAQTLTLSYGTDNTTVTNALGNTTTYQYNAAGELTAVIAPTVNGVTPTTSYTYDANGNLLTSTDANGAVTSYSYDANGNLLSVEDGAGNTVSYTYNAGDQVLSQTTYTVPAQGEVGQPGYVPPSGAQTTYDVYNFLNQLLYVIDPVGNVTQNTYTATAAGIRLSSTQQYLGASYALAGLSPSTPPTLAALQSWVASSAVQSTLSQSTRTDYTYDARGQLATQTQWDTISATGTGVSDAGTVVTTTTYSAQGQLLQTSTQRGSALQTTSYAYDGLGRLISSTDPLGNVTSYVYTDSANTLAITQANGLTTTQVRNSAGQLISSTSSATTGQTSRVTSHLYNTAGQSVATIDPAGNVSYTFYNADGEVAGTVDATGAVTAYTYDADGHVIGTTQYATLISTAGWVSGGALTASLPTALPLPSPSANDRTSHTLYNADGQAVATIDPEGNVTTTVYNGVGNAISTTAYATALTTAQLTALGTTPTLAALQADLVSSSANRTAYTIYDADGRAVATINAAGDVTTQTYNGAGDVVLSTAYATALTTAQLTALGSTPTLAALQADLTASSANQVTYNYYDATGRLVAQVDADGYLTITAYNETTNTTTTTRYATALTTAQLTALVSNESTATLVGLLGSNTTNQQSSMTYNADNQLVSATGVDGTVTAYTYNSVGLLLTTTVTPTAGQGTARTTSATYDAFGDTLTSVDGNHATTTYTYNVLGQRVSATDGLGNATYTFYDADGRVAYTAQGQPNGSTRNGLLNITAYAYSAFGQLTSTRQYAYQFDIGVGNPSNLPLAEVAAVVATFPVSASDANDLTQYTYTLDGQVASTTNGDNYQTAYAYDAFGDLTQTQQQLSGAGSALSAANSTITTDTYNALGEQTGETDGVGTAVARSTSSTYDAFGRVTSTTDGNGNVVTYGYDNLGRQVSTSQTVQGTARTTQTTYDAFARVVTQTDALGNVTAYQYNLAAHTTTITTPDGVTMTTAKDAFGDTVSVTDGAGDITTYTYDADGRLLSTKDALGNVSTDQYDADGDLLQTTDATGHIVTYTYNASGQVLTQTVDPSSLDPGGLNLTTTYAYDGEGRELSVTDPTGVVTTYAYDAEGNTLTQVQDAGTGKLNLTTTSTYDGEGKTLTVTVGAGSAAARTTQYVYDNLERLSQQIVDPGTGQLNLTTRYTYDANNNLTSVTDPNGNVTRSVYDAANEQVYSINAAGAVTQNGYDADGRVTSTRAYATALTTAQLTALGTAPSVAAVTADLVSSANDAVSYTAYNAEGQVRYSIDPMGNVTETRYDAAGRVSETLAYAHAVSVTAGEATVLQGSQATALSSVAALVSGVGNTDATAEATLHLYDADGHTRFLVQQNTVNGQLVGQVSGQTYDAAGRVIASTAYGTTLALSTNTALTTQLTTSSVTQALASAPNHTTLSVYDNAGRLRYTIDDTDHVTETRYDADGRVTEQLVYANAITLPGTLTVASVGAAVTTAGTAGARISTTTYDDAGRVLTTGDALGVNATYTYDATGLQLSAANRDGAVTITTYDAAGRKTLVQSPSVTVGSYSGGVLQTANQYLYTSYGYDNDGNVTSISQGSGPSAGAITNLSTTTYAYDAVGHQISTTNALAAATHVTYNAQGEAVTQENADGYYQYNVYNADGELAYAVDDDGYVTGTSYDAYGNVTAVTRYATALNTAAITGWSAGQPLTLAQLPQGLVTSSSDRTTTTTYNQLNQQTQVVQPSITYALSMGALGGTSETGSPTTDYTYDAYGNVTSTAQLVQGAATSGSTTTPAIWETTYTYYDALNRVVMVVAPAGSYTSPQGYVTTTSYDGFGDVASTTQYAQAISTSSITTGTAPALPAAPTVATGGNRTTTYTYDAIGRALTATATGVVNYTGSTVGVLGAAAGVGYTTANSVTSYTYNGENQIASVTVNGATTSTTYDAAGRVLSVTGPARQVLVSNWQSILESTPADDLSTAALYTTASPVTTYVYDALGDTLSTTVAGAGVTSQQTLATYNALGQQVKLVDADGNVTNYTYDANGNLLTQSYALTGNNGASSTVTTTNTYDADNRQLTTAVQRSGQTGYDSYSQVKYNAFGEVVAKGDNNGYEATYTYNNAGQQTSAPNSTTGAVHTFAYDLVGNQVVDSSLVTGGSTAVWTHDGYNLANQVIAQVTAATDAASGVDTSTPIVYTHDRWGNVTSTTDANGNVTTYEYDGQDHQIEETEADVMVVSASGVRTWATPTKAWYYNVNGELVGSTDENGNTSWNAYDAAGNLTIAVDATGAKTTTAYDALGRAVAQETPPAQTATGAVSDITYTTYNALNQVTVTGDLEFNSAGTARVLQAEQTYVLNSHGDRIQVTDALGNTTYYVYDSQHRVLQSQTPLQYSAGQSTTYAYDVNGNLIRETDADGHPQSWVYDYFGRMLSHVDESGATYTYTYDASSGLLTNETSNWTGGTPSPSVNTTLSFAYMADGQLAQLNQTVGGVASTYAYQYDANGNQTLETDTTQDGAATAVAMQTVTTYDSHNRLQEVTLEDAGVPTMRTAYNYDAAGNRRAVFVESSLGSTATPITGNGAPPTGSVAAQTANPGAAWNLNVASDFTDNVGFGLTFTATQSNGSALPSWMTFNSSGSFGGTPTTAGSWTVTVTGTDVNGQSVSSTFVVTVPLATPVFTAGAGPMAVIFGNAFSFAVPAATDPNGLAITYTASYYNGSAWVALPSWLSFNASTLTFSGTPPAGSAGAYDVAYGAAAGGFNPAQSFTLTVLSTPPVYTSGVANQTTYGGAAFSFSDPTSAFSESDGSALTFTAGTYAMNSGVETDSALPSWMSFNASTLTFSGTPPTSAVGSTFTLYLSGTNPQGQKAEAYFTVTVAQYVQPAPVYNGGLTNQTGTIAGASVNIPVASSFSQPGGGALTYTGMVLIPDHQLQYPVEGGADTSTRDVPAHWEAISEVGLSVNATTGAVTGVPTTLGYVIAQNTTGPGTYQYDSTYQLEIIATNGQAGTVAGTFTMTNGFAPPAQLSAPANQTVNPGQGMVQAVQSTNFSDPYAHGLTYSATLSSGAALPSGLSWSGSDIDVGAVAAGSYAIKITATDGLGHTGTTTFTLTVNNVAPVISGAMTNITGAAGNAMASYQAPAATDANGDAITYSASGLPAGITFNASTRTFSGTPAAVGTTTVTYTATASQGASVSATFTITINAPVYGPPVYHGGLTEIDFDAGVAETYQIPAGMFTNPAGRAMTYTLTGAGAASINATTGLISCNAPNVKITKTDNAVLTVTDPVDGLSVVVDFVVQIEGNSGTEVVKAGASLAQAAQTQTTTTPNIQADWFTYDADDRVLVNDGSLTNSQIVVASGTANADSGENFYDAAGNVVQYNTVNASNQTLVEQKTYDARNELKSVETQTTPTSLEAVYQTQSYDADGHLISTVTYQTPGNPEAGTDAGNLVTFTDGGWVASDTIDTYNASGELTDQSVYAEDSAQNLINLYGTGVASSAYASQDGAAPATLPTVTSNTDGALFLVTENNYTGAGLGYDADGNVLGYQTTTTANSTVVNSAPTASTSDTTDAYVLQNSALNTTTTMGATSTSTNTYNDLGELTKTVVTGSAAQTTTMAYAADGKILQETASGITTMFAYAQGQGLGSVTSTGTIDALNTSSGYSNSSLGAQSYQVQAGDTLQSVAQNLYGDSNYGYIIAQANGLAIDGTLTPGTSLKIPQIITNANNASTFQPYNQSAIVNPNASTGLTVAQLITASIEAMLNQQTLVNQMIAKVEAEVQQAKAQAAAAAVAAAAAKAAAEAAAEAAAAANRTLNRETRMERPAFAAQAMIGVGEEDTGGGPPSVGVDGNVDSGSGSSDYSSAVGDAGDADGSDGSDSYANDVNLANLTYGSDTTIDYAINSDFGVGGDGSTVSSSFSGLGGAGDNDSFGSGDDSLPSLQSDGNVDFPGGDSSIAQYGGAGYAGYLAGGTQALGLTATVAMRCRRYR